jgi:hypothetical protein
LTAGHVRLAVADDITTNRPAHLTIANPLRASSSIVKVGNRVGMAEAIEQVRQPQGRQRVDAVDPLIAPLDHLFRLVGTEDAVKLDEPGSSIAHPVADSPGSKG